MDTGHERFDRVFEEHYRTVLGYAIRRTDPDVAQEVAAETFLVAWRRIDDIPEPPRASVAVGLISQPLASPALRGAVFDFLAGRTGVTNRGTTTDVLGRSGVLLVFTPPEGGVYTQRADTELIVDPSDGRLLQMRGGFRSDDPGGQGYGATFTYIGPLVVPSAGVLPDGVATDFPFVTPSTSGASTAP